MLVFILFQVMHGTGGRGADLVLNSLAEEKLQASLRCLARHGRFLEIGKYDLSNNTPLGMALFLKNISFHGILLDAIFEDDNPEWKEVSDLVTAGIASGIEKIYTCRISPCPHFPSLFALLGTFLFGVLSHSSVAFFCFGSVIEIFTY